MNGSVPHIRRNVLFVCSRNQWRSPTAERVFRRDPRVNTRSAGTSPNARHPVNESDLRWADLILPEGGFNHVGVEAVVEMVRGAAQRVGAPLDPTPSLPRAELA